MAKGGVGRGQSGGWRVEEKMNVDENYDDDDDEKRASTAAKGSPHDSGSGNANSNGNGILSGGAPPQTKPEPAP